MSAKSIREIKHQDLVNNNHIGSLEEKTKRLSLSSESSFLFDPNLLVDLKPEIFQFQYDKFEPNRSGVDLGDNLTLRPLRRDDFARNYMDLLAQLTECGQTTREQFESRFDLMRSAAGTYYICVVEDTSKSKLIASLTLVYEQKFIRGMSARGRVEDMVVDVDYRGKKLSKILLDVVCQLAKTLGCYKISLECKDHLKKHYEQFGFALEPGQNYLCRRY